MRPACRPVALLAAAFVSLLPVVAAATDWEFTWTHPQPQGSALLGLSFPTAQRGYAVGTDGAVLRTDDGGTTWTALHDWDTVPAHLLSVHALDVDTVIAVGTGIWRSTDGGVSFTEMAHPAAPLRDVVAVPGGDLSAASESGNVFRSSDGGLTWNDVGPGSGLIRRHVWRTALEGYAVGQNVAHRTTDGGATWNAFVTPPFFGFNDIYFSDALTGHVEDDFGFGTSTDGGVTWTLMSAPTEPLYRYRATVIDSQRWFLTSFLEGGDLHETTDGGATWTLRDSVFNLGFPTIVQTPGGRLVWTSDTGDIRWSDDGALTVTSAVTNFAETVSAPMLTFLDRHDGTVFASNQPNSGAAPRLWMRSDDAGRTWAPAANPPNLFWVQTGEFAPDALTGVAGYSGTVAYTSDGGVTWNTTTLPTNQRVATFAAPSAASLFLLTFNTAGTGALYRSTDGGATWGSTATGLPASFQGQAIHFRDPQHGTIGITASAAARLYRTTDGGASWSQIVQSGLPTDAVSDLWWSDDQLGLATVRNGSTPGIYRTTDAGATWTRKSTPSGQGLTMRDDGFGAVWGVFSSPARVTEDFGETWSTLAVPQTFPVNLSARAPTCALATADGILTGGPNNAVILAEPVGATDAPDLVAETTGGLRFEGARPNPFRESTSVTFSLERRQNVVVTVHDVAG
ncbi:MAG: hypothetical protein KC591_03365, partial [Gemmatimonadetes bacterium]|nr:hypothetical protein [Gemmatimonadota bacterium]